MNGLEKITSPSGASFWVAKPHAERFRGLIGDLESSGYGIKPKESGGYNYRTIAGTNKLSQHAHGNAIDINWMDNARGTAGNIPPDLARQLAQKHGMKWGGDWKNPDPMHFEVAVPGQPGHTYGDGHNHGAPPAAVPSASPSPSAAPATGAAPAMTPYTGPSPDDVSQSRRMAQMLMQQGTSTEPVQHWTQAIARVLQGGVGGMYQNQAKTGEQQGTQAMVQALSGGQMNPAAMVANPWTRDLGMKMAQSQFAQNTPQAQAELQGTQLQNQIRQRQLAQPVDDGSKVLESGGQIFRVPRQGDATVIGGMDPIAQAQKQAAARRVQVEAAGIDPNSPAGKAYIASGKMPREDQQPLTATDKKAILEADEAVSRGQGVLENLDKAIELSKKAYTGPTAGVRGYITSLAGSEGGKATEELTNVITSNSLAELKSIFGGNPTEGERKILLDIQGSVNKAPEVREKIFARAKQMAQRRLDLARKQADEIRGGDYYKSAKDRKQPAEAEQPAKRLKFNPATGELE